MARRSICRTARWLAEALHAARTWVLSYDRCPAIAELYSWARCYVVPAAYCVSGPKANWVTNEELVITPRAVALPATG